MRKFKSNILKVSLAMGLLLSSSFPAYAVSTDSTVVGGWDEDTGYFVNADAYNKAMEKRGLLRSDPVHEGERQRKDQSGNTYFRAHGWTSWPGVYHYTRARMETYGGSILTDSGRKWGTSETQATSPWYKFDPDVSDRARTYYGSEE